MAFLIFFSARFKADASPTAAITPNVASGKGLVSAALLYHPGQTPVALMHEACALRQGHKLGILSPASALQVVLLCLSNCVKTRLPRQ